MRSSSKSTSQGASACVARLLRLLAALLSSSPELERAEAGGEGLPRALEGGEGLLGGRGTRARAEPGGVCAPSAGGGAAPAALPCCSWLVTQESSTSGVPLQGRGEAQAGEDGSEGGSGSCRPHTSSRQCASVPFPLPHLSVGLLPKRMSGTPPAGAPCCAAAPHSAAKSCTPSPMALGLPLPGLGWSGLGLTACAPLPPSAGSAPGGAAPCTARRRRRYQTNPPAAARAATPACMGKVDGEGRGGCKGHQPAA